MRLNNDIIKNTADGPLYITLQQQEANGEWQTVSYIRKFNGQAKS
jgi:hypothetical protein